MMDRPTEKQTVHARTSRQIRPILGSILFLLAANLVAKGALGIGHYNPNPILPNVPGNVQGSLFLSVNQPHGNNWNSKPAPYTHDNWFPLHGVPYSMPYATTTPKSRPVNQQQIINIREPLFGEAPEDNYQDISEGPQQQVIINKSRYDMDAAASEEHRVLIKPDEIETTQTTEETNQTREIKKEEAELAEQVTGIESTTIEIPPDVELLPGNFTGRQNAATTPPGNTMRPMTTMPTTTTSTTTTSTTTTTTTTTTARPPATNQTTNNTGPYPNGYGPPMGNDNVTFTTPAPGNATGMGLQPPPAGNNTNATLPPVYTAPGQYPNADYGPSNGNEHISITYGPTQYRPFFSSPEDPYLNHNQPNQYYNQPSHDQNHYYNNRNYYEHNYQQDNQNYNQFYTSQSNLYSQPPQLKYNDIFSKFYNKFDYHYPSFYNNYLNK